MILVHFAEIIFKKMHIFVNVFTVLKLPELFISISGLGSRTLGQGPNINMNLQPIQETVS